MKVYLAGAMAGCSDEECKDWREKVISILGPNVTCLNPMVRDYRHREFLPDDIKFIVEGDKGDINKSDYVLVNYTKPSVGTSMEILYSWERNKPVIIINSQSEFISPWLIYHSSYIVDSIEDACELINQ
jgi:nucleoside 2-deoxyribosyltransferase